LRELFQVNINEVEADSCGQDDRDLEPRVVRTDLRNQTP
jgi:hypothetical protein